MQELVWKLCAKIGKILESIPQYKQSWQSQSAHTRKSVKLLITGCFLIVLVGGGWQWYSHTQAKSTNQHVVLVRTQIVGNKNARQQYTYSGEVHGRVESQLAFQVGGKIFKRNVDLGSRVSAGDILLQIDPKDIQQTVNSSSAQVSSAQAQLRLAESNLQRYRQLYEQDAVSQAQYDQYVNAYEAALAASRQASAQYSQGTNQLDYSSLRASAAGVVSAINAEAGQVVSAGQPILTLVQDGEREVEISVPENRVEEVRTAQQINVSFWALPEVVIEGKIREISPIADAATRTYKVRITLMNPPEKIKLGMTASVQIAGTGVKNQAALEIPLSAVYQTDGSAGVWVVNNEIVSLKSITVGEFGNAKIQVLSGLTPGETIVTAGVHKLREGQKVRLAAGIKP